MTQDLVICRTCRTPIPEEDLKSWLEGEEGDGPTIPDSTPSQCKACYNAPEGLDRYGNVPRKEGFSQVCIMTGALVRNDLIADFEGMFLERFKLHIQFLETIVTAPDMKNGHPIPGSGGRHDAFFAIKEGQVLFGRFAIERLTMGIRWIEDGVSKTNGGGALWPERIKHYVTWLFDDIDLPKGFTHPELDRED